MKQKIKIKAVLPQALKQAIFNLGLSRINTEKCLRLAFLILQKQRYKHEGLYYYVPMAVNYLQTVFNKDCYTGFFNAMKRSGIIQSNGIHRRGSAFRKGIATGYRINDQYLSGEFTQASFDIALKNNESMTSQESIWYNRSFFSSYHNPGNPLSSLFSYPCCSLPYYYPSFPKQLVYDDLASLYYDIPSIKSVVEATVASINENSFRVGEKVLGDKIEVNNRITKKKYYTSKKWAVKWAERKGCSLVQDESKFYLVHLESYISRKKSNVTFRYDNFLECVRSVYFYADRNNRNSRLDHNFTTLGKDVLRIIKGDNDLMELDLSNSQFAIHAHWLRLEGQDKSCRDVELYCEICASGRLYEHLAELLGITREAAKLMMMMVAFSKPDTSTPEKELFRSCFPNVLAHIDGFKQEKTRDPRFNKNGYKEFAVELQKMEAEMFVDNLYPNIKELGLFCLTKHDSLLFRRKDKDVVLAIVQEYFDHLGFQANYKVE